VALLPENRPETVAAWLERQPDLEVLTRDRETTYASVVRAKHPGVVQVADLWPLLQNLGDALRTFAERHPVVVEETDGEKAKASSARPTAGELRRRSRYEAIQRRIQEGKALRAIARECSLDPRTVRKYARSAAPPGHASRGRKRPSLLDSYLGLLEEAYRNGTRTGIALFQVLTHPPPQAPQAHDGRPRPPGSPDDPAPPHAPSGAVSAAKPKPTTIASVPYRGVREVEPEAPGAGVPLGRLARTSWTRKATSGFPGGKEKTCQRRVRGGYR